ncbi:hypothetical protein NIES2101_06380 [Calothrix sp. HK-06]|nr:hypothetical protein NIES2101_06380 [Calothrix sp. HK-06]
MIVTFIKKVWLVIFDIFLGVLACTQKKIIPEMSINLLMLIQKKLMGIIKRCKEFSESVKSAEC